MRGRGKYSDINSPREAHAGRVMMSRVECGCQETDARVGAGGLEAFAAVRSGCPALRRILVPDAAWPDFQTWHLQVVDDTHHRSILLLAMERGHLGRVTSAVHRYLISADVPQPNLRRQYLKDLREDWMRYPNPLERHRKFRSFFGRLVELQCAEWLESQGWTISGLEALREGPDIEAHILGGQVTAFEVKFIGADDDDFELVLKSLSDQPAVASVSPYVAANYLLFRTYEAAKQLQQAACGRVAVVAVDDQTWYRFDRQLRDHWINWADPRFFNGDNAWERFLEQKRTQYPQLDTDLRSTLRSVNALWILRLLYGYEYSREFEINTSGAPDSTRADAAV